MKRSPLAYLSFFIGLILASVGMSMTVKANVGIGAVNALATTMSYISPLTVGTWIIILNGSAVLTQLALHRRFNLAILLQFVLTFIMGRAVDFFFYQYLMPLTISHYWLRLFMFIFGNSLTAFAIAFILHLKIVLFPIEGACQAIANQFDKRFFTIRFSLDIILIILTLSITLVLKLPFTIREGTILGMLIFSKNVDMALNYLASLEHHKQVE